MSHRKLSSTAKSNERRIFITLAQAHYKDLFGKVLLGFVTERKRSELALAALVQEAVINGVSTRRIEKLAQALRIENISASQVSEINKGLEEQVEQFRSRLLEEEYPFLWIDAHYDKVRVEDRVMTLALLVAHGVNARG